MQFISETTTDGVVERGFTIGEVPGVLWSPERARARSTLILSGHPGGLHKRAPGVVARARALVVGFGFAVAALDAPGHGDRPRSDGDAAWVRRILIARRAGEPLGQIVSTFNASLADRAVPEWQAALDRLQRLPDIDGEHPVGYTGMTLATEVGIRLAAIDARIGAAVFGAAFASDELLEAARQVTAPVQYLVQWDDPEIDRESAFALFDAFATTDKVLRATTGPHSRVPRIEIDESSRRLAYHLGATG